MTPAEQMYASTPVWVDEIGQWVVSVDYRVEPGASSCVVHATYSFDTKDEADSFVAKTNGSVQ